MKKSLFFPLAERLFQEPRRRSRPKPRECVRETPGRCRNPVLRGPPPRPEGSFLFPVLTCLVGLPQHRPPPFPTPDKTQVRERAKQARAQRRRAAGRSPCVVAAILGLRRAAEAGTTRATPSVGVAGNRVGEDDSAKAHQSCQLRSKFYSEPLMSTESLKIRGITREKTERR